MHVSLSGVEGCFSKYGWKNYVYIFLVALMILSYVGITNDLIIDLISIVKGIILCFILITEDLLNSPGAINFNQNLKQ